MLTHICSLVHMALTYAYYFPGIGSERLLVIILLTIIKYFLSPHSLRIAKMNKEMREMDGFAQSGQTGGLGGAEGGTGAGAGDLIVQTKKSFQAFKNHLSGWALGGQSE